MSSLTLPINRAYAERVAAKSAAGFDRPIDQGAQAPNLHVSGVFLRLEASLYGGMHWEAFGLAGFLDLRSVNPMYAVTILIDSGGCRLVLNQIKDTHMAKPLFRVDDSVTSSDLADHIRYLSYQVGAVHDALTEFSSCKSSMQSQRGFEHHGWLLWAMGSLLEQQRALCERLEEVGLSVPTGGDS